MHFFCFKHPCTPPIVLHFICSKNSLLSSERSEFSANQANVRANGLKNVLQNILLTDRCGTPWKWPHPDCSDRYYSLAYSPFCFNNSRCEPLKKVSVSNHKFVNLYCTLLLTNVFSFRTLHTKIRLFG